MVNRVRHIRARRHEWVRVHRASRPRSSAVDDDLWTWILGVIAIVAGGWIAVLAAIAIWRWLVLHWEGFAAGLILLSIILAGLHLAGWRR